MNAVPKSAFDTKKHATKVTPVDHFTFLDHDTSSEVQENADKLKEERAVLAALCAEDAWPFIKKRLNTDLIVNKPLVNDLVQCLRKQQDIVIFGGLDEWATQKNAESDTHCMINQAYGRLLEITNYISDSRVSENENNNVVQFLHEGFGTSLVTIWGLFEVIPEVFEIQYNRKMNRRELADTIQHNYAFIIPFARGHRELSIKTLAKLSSYAGRKLRKRPSTKREKEREKLNEQLITVPTFNPDCFIFDKGKIQEKTTYTLYVRDYVLKHLGESNKKKPILDRIPLSVTTGCPALAAKVDGKINLIKAMWNWCFELAEKHYFPLFSEDTKSQ